jgi:hypothetical protein
MDLGWFCSLFDKNKEGKKMSQDSPRIEYVPELLNNLRADLEKDQNSSPDYLKPADLKESIYILKIVLMAMGSDVDRDTLEAWIMDERKKYSDNPEGLKLSEEIYRAFLDWLEGKEPEPQYHPPRCVKFVELSPSLT